MQLGHARPHKRITFVGNLVHQVLALLAAPENAVNRRTFFLAGYELTTIAAWSEQISAALGRPKPHTLPEWAVVFAARAGDVFSSTFRRAAPLTSARLANMRADTSTIPIEAIQTLVPSLPYTIEEGVQRTVAWLRERGCC